MSCAEKDPEGQQLVSDIMERNRKRRGLERIVGEAMGYGSMCWSPKPTGEFQSVEASAQVQSAVEEIWELMGMKVSSSV